MLSSVMYPEHRCLKKVGHFCSDIGTIFSILEENMPFANKAELYISILKEAVRKDVKGSGSHLVSLDYCIVEHASTI